MDYTDIQQDSGRYLQEYVQSLENLPSEIKYHWAELQNRNDVAKNLERRMHMNQHDLDKLHKQWFHPEQEKKDKVLRNEPVLIKRIQRDYDKLEDLAAERIELVEGVDRHLNRLGHDLEQVDEPGGSSTSRSSMPGRYSRMHKKSIYAEDDDILDDAALYEPPPIKQPTRKRKERDENENEPLYCYCRQVSYGEMVACDGEHCPYEWFHMDCVGLDAPPKGAWYCDDCLAELHRRSPPAARKSSTSGHAHKKLKRKKDSLTPS
ncbi:phdfinger domain containing protein [Lichtheimia corymbifera JMRC:FSU:9682]|uniref:Chromatin modification-related protein n=1 Tax=Lichtheimia corymbifera JMRC:FSU:9682 TaxID=1263082 RepID=A0A068RTT7_9FUNG|nr:phdfinger domain containing protein [Lichtheimia corymbifera JMRC:FSU:9682]